MAIDPKEIPDPIAWNLLMRVLRLSSDEWRRLAIEQYGYVDDIACDIQEGAEFSDRMRRDLAFHGGAAHAFQQIAWLLDGEEFREDEQPATLPEEEIPCK